MRSLVTYTSIFLALSLFSNTAVADDICPGDIFAYSLEDQKYTLWITEVPRVQFRQVESCDPSRECRYGIHSAEFGSNRVIADSLIIDDICNSFERTEAESENPYYESGDRTLFTYTRKREISYRFSDDFLLLQIVVSQYFDGPKDDPWGRFEGDDYSGKTLQLGVEVVRIFLGSAN